MIARRIAPPLMFLLLLFFLAVFWVAQSETTAVSTEYTGGELIIFASSLNHDVQSVGTDGSGSPKKNATSYSFSKTLLGYRGKSILYFGSDRVITKINFIFPNDTPWNDVANRISEQLGEPSLARLYNSGGAGAQWESGDSLFYLATDGKTTTLSVTNYYGDESSE